MTTKAKADTPLTDGPPRPAPRQYTLEEYLRREARSGIKHEFYNGKITRMPYAKGPHNIIAANVIGALSAAIENIEKNYVLFSSDQKIYFPELNEGVYADALVVCEKPEYWDDEALLLTNPMLVVEVLSKSTQRYDRRGKFDKYKTLPSFREYLMLRQDAHYAEIWYRERPGLWHETICTDLEERLPLRSMGIEFLLSKAYRNAEVAK